jgi:hypothetical protein
LEGFDDKIVKECSSDDLNENPTFKFFIYPCVVTTIRACFDQNIFIVADDCKIG